MSRYFERGRATTYLVAELVVGTGELAVRDPHRDTFSLGQKPAVNVRTKVFVESIRRGSERPNPHFTPHSLVNALYGVAQTAVTARAVLEVPFLAGDARVDDRGHRRGYASMALTGHGAGLAALDARGGMAFIGASHRSSDWTMLADLELLGLGCATLGGCILGEAGELGEGVGTLLGG